MEIKWKILIALYLEYQSVAPENTRITPELLEIENEYWFFVGLRKLENEGYVRGVTQQGTLPVFDFLKQDMGYICITKAGIDEVEKIFELPLILDVTEKLSFMSTSGRVSGEIRGFVEMCIDKLSK